MLGSFGKVREILIRKVDHPSAHVLFRQLDEVLSDAISNTARAAVQYDPDALRLVEADLDEVIPSAERAEVIEVVTLSQTGMLGDDRGVLRLEMRPHLDRPRRRIPPRPSVVPPAAVGPPVRHSRLDRRSKSVKIIRQIRRAKRCPNGHHPAADIDA